MKSSILRGLALLAMLTPLVAQAAVPANDRFETATVIVPGSGTLFNQTGVGSTADVFDPYIGGVKLARSVWYQFDATATTAHAQLTIADRAGVRAGVFQLADADGSAGTLTFLAQTTNTNSNDTETLQFPTVLGHRYYLCVEANGQFDVNVPLQVHTPDNDNFADAITLNGDEGTVEGNNVGATNTDIPNASDFVITSLNNGVWYRWTPSFTGNAVVDTNFSELPSGDAHETILAVYTGTSLESTGQIASAGGNGVDNASRVVFAATSGTTYYIWVGTDGSVRPPQPGPFFLSYYKASNPGYFDIKAPTGGFPENIGTVDIAIVRRWHAGNVSAGVTIASSNGTAVAPTNYVAIQNALSFADPGADGSAVRQDVFVTIKSAPGRTVSFNMQLSNPTGGATLSSTGTSQMVEILDSSSAAGFATPTLTVKETDGTVYVPLTRVAASNKSTTHVTSAKTQGTATGGLDYIPVDAYVTFQPGQTLAYLPVTILNDGKYEGNETIVLNAESWDVSDLIGYDTLTVTIEDDDVPVPVAGRLAARLDAGEIAGSVDISITSVGAVTGKVIMSKGVFPLTGTLVNGRLTVPLGPATAPTRTLTIQMFDAANKGYQITLNDGDLGSTVSTVVYATNFSKLSPCPRAGNYTFADANGGGGVGQLVAASFTVDALGTATLAGKIYDGTALVGSGAVDSNLFAWMGASLYGGKGRALILAGLSTTPQTLTHGQLRFVRPGRSNQTVELAGVQTQAVIDIARYTPPTAGQRALTIWSGGTGNAVLTQSGVNGIGTETFTISPTNVVKVNGANSKQLKLTITPSTGYFTGSVIPPGATTSKPINGVLLQGGASSSGKGFFLNGIIPGRIFLN